MESTKNFSNTPLLNSRSYIGTPEDVLQYNTTQFQLTSDTVNEITIYQSNDRITYTTTKISYTTPNVSLSCNVPLLCRFIFYNIENNSGTNQTSFNLRVLYRNTSSSSVLSRIVWNTVQTGAGGYSSIVSFPHGVRNYTIYGNVSLATDLTVELSCDGVTFFDSQSVYSTLAGNLGFNLTLCSPYVRLKSSEDVLAKVYISAL